MGLLNKILSHFTSEKKVVCRTCGSKIYFAASINPTRCPSCVNYWTAVTLGKTRTPIWKYLKNKGDLSKEER